MNSQQQDDITDYFKTKRDQYVVEIRKNKTIQNIAAKRAKLSKELLPNGDTQEVSAMIAQAADFFSNALKAGNYQEITSAVEQIRRILSQTEKGPSAELLATGIVPHIVNLIDPRMYDYEDLMVECCWSIANIASGDTRNVELLLQWGLSPRLVNILDHPNVEVRENAAWGLANIAGDCPKHRDFLFQDNVVRKIIACMSDYSYDADLTTHVMWLVANLCKAEPYPEFYEMGELLPLLQSILLESQVTETLHHVLSVLYTLSDTDQPDQIEDILGMEVLEKIFEFLESEELKLKNMALKVIGHFLTGEDSQVQYLINRGVIQAIAPLLNDQKRQIKKHAVWAISNILACSYDIIEHVLSYKDEYILTTLFHMVHNEDYEISQECIFALSNICTGGSLEQMQKLVSQGLIEILVNALREYKDPETLTICMQAIENLLQEAKSIYDLGDKSENPYLLKLEQCGGIDLIQDLQEHKDEELYTVVSRLIKNHFDYVE